MPVDTHIMTCGVGYLHIQPMKSFIHVLTDSMAEGCCWTASFDSAETCPPSMSLTCKR